MKDIIACIFNSVQRTSLAFILVGLAIALYLIWHYIKEDVIKHVLHRRNIFYDSLFVVSVFVSIAYSIEVKTFGIGHLIIFALLAIVLWFIINSLKPKTGCNYYELRLKKYLRKLNEGEANNYYNKLIKHELLWTNVDISTRIDYYHLKAVYQQELNDCSGAYKTLTKIDDKNLYPEEIDYFKYCKAVNLAQIGGLLLSKSLLDDIKGKLKKSPDVLIAYADIYEKQGNIKEAYKYAGEAITQLEQGNPSEYLKVKIFNNYARYSYYNGNRKDALRYYKKAYSIVKKSKDVVMYEVVLSNIILQKQMNGDSKEEIDSLINEYENIVPNDIHMLINYYNTLIQYYLYANNFKKVYDLTKEMYDKNISKLDNKSSKEILKTSIFTILMRNCFIHNWYDKDVVIEYEYYKDIELLTKLKIFQDYIRILGAVEFRVLTLSSPYDKLYSMIMKYYKEEALNEIDNYIDSIESYEEYKYRNIIDQRLFILNELEKDSLNKNEEEFLSVTNRLKENTLYLEAFVTLRLLINECLNFYNNDVYNLGLKEKMYFREFLNMTMINVPAPILSKDGYHVDYSGLLLSNPIIIKKEYRGVVERNIDKLIEIYDLIIDHPNKGEYALFIGNVLDYLNRNSEVDKYKNDCIKYGITYNESLKNNWAKDITI